MYITKTNGLNKDDVINTYNLSKLNDKNFDNDLYFFRAKSVDKFVNRNYYSKYINSDLCSEICIKKNNFLTSPAANDFANIKEKEFFLKYEKTKKLIDFTDTYIFVRYDDSYISLQLDFYSLEHDFFVEYKTMTDLDEVVDSNIFTFCLYVILFDKILLVNDFYELLVDKEYINKKLEDISLEDFIKNSVNKTKEMIDSIDSCNCYEYISLEEYNRNKDHYNNNSFHKTYIINKKLKLYKNKFSNVKTINILSDNDIYIKEITI